MEAQMLLAIGELTKTVDLSARGGSRGLLDPSEPKTPSPKAVKERNSSDAVFATTSTRN